MPFDKKGKFHRIRANKKTESLKKLKTSLSDLSPLLRARLFPKSQKKLEDF